MHLLTLQPCPEKQPEQALSQKSWQHIQKVRGINHTSENTMGRGVGCDRDEIQWEQQVERFGVAVVRRKHTLKQLVHLERTIARVLYSAVAMIWLGHDTKSASTHLLTAWVPI